MGQALGKRIDGQSTNDVDIAIVGAGPAGLATAYGLQDTNASIRVFEQSADVGGRTATTIVNGLPINTGAMFVYLGTRTEQMCSELGVSWLPVEPETFGVYCAGKLVISRDSETLAEQLPVSEQARHDFGRVVRQMRDAPAAFGGMGSQDLAAMSLSEFLGPLDPAAAAIVWAAVAGASHATPDELSAQYGLRYFASYLMHAHESRGLIREGMQQICRALHKRLADGVVELETTVEAIDPCAKGGWSLRLRHGDVVRHSIAKHVVMAVPGPSVQALVPSLPDEKISAIARVPTPASVSLAVTVDCSDRPAWEEIFMIVTVGTKFQVLLQPMSGPAFLPRESHQTYFVLYRVRDAVDVIRSYDSPALTEDWLEDFYKVLPDARGRVTGTFFRRWEAGFAYPGKDRAMILPDVRAPVGTMHFAGDYTSATAGTHGAFSEADRVCAALRAELLSVNQTQTSRRDG